MRTSIITLLTLAAAVQVAHAESFTDYAQVRNVEPQYQRVNSPQKHCWTETVEDDRGGPRAGGNTAGMILGGVAGAVAGHQVGQGRGKDAATAIGAVAGAMIGSNYQDGKGWSRDQDTREVQRCRTEDQWTQQLTGYRVTYEYAGRRYTTVMPNDPGRTLRINVSVSPWN